MSTVTNTKVAVKYRWNVSSLSIDMSADNRTTTLGQHIDQHIGQVSVDILADARPICRPIYRATHLDRHIDPHSTDMLTNISIDTWLICQPIRRSVDMSTDMSVEGCTKYTWSEYLTADLGRRGVLRDKRLMGMCRWMGSHFHNWIDYHGVAFSIQLLERGHTFSKFWG